MKIEELIGKGKPFEPPFRITYSKDSGYAMIDSRNKKILRCTDIWIMGASMAEEAAVFHHIYELLADRWKDNDRTNDVKTIAAINKLYLNENQFCEFFDWVLKHYPSLLRGFYHFPPGTFMHTANFSWWQDRLLLWRCPFPSVREYLEKQRGLKTRWYHKLFFTK